MEDNPVYWLQFDTLALFGAVLLVVIAVFFWALLFRKNGGTQHRQRRRHHKKTGEAPDNITETIEEPAPGKRFRRRRHEHRHMNPTLAQDGGLPPVRPNLVEDPPIQPPPTPTA
jgi:hypothetical protein